MVCRVFVRSRAASLERSDRHSGGHLRRRRGPSRRGLERGECFCVTLKTCVKLVLLYLIKQYIGRKNNLF